MGRPNKQPHEVVPVRRGTKCYANFAGRPFYLGRWDEANDRPSPAAGRRLEELRAVWTADPLAAGTRSRPGDPLLAVLWDEWRRSPEGDGAYAEQAARAERFLFGPAAAPGPYSHHRATAFRGAELRDFQRALCRAGLSRDSVTKTVGCVRKCFAWALVGRRVGYEQYRELELVEPPAKGKVKEARRRTGVPWEAVEATLALLSPPLAAAVRLLWLTGARPSEILATRAGEVLRGGPLHAESGVVLDLDALRVWAVVRRVHKTDGTAYDRVIFFGPKAQAVLRDLLAGLDADTPLFRPADGSRWATAAKRTKRTPGGYGTYKPRKGAAGKRRPRELYDWHALKNAVVRAADRAGVAKWTPYQMRHQVARLVQQAHGRDATRVFLGHQVGGVTEDYAGTDLTAAARVALAWG